MTRSSIVSGDPTASSVVSGDPTAVTWHSDTGTRTMIPLHAGRFVVADIGNPQAAEIDAEWMWNRVEVLRRFNGHPKALSVLRHQWLCREIGLRMGCDVAVTDWAMHHDCHEAFLGDIIAPVEAYLASARLRHLKRVWDEAIARRLGLVLDDGIRTQVHRLDLIARRIEMMGMGLTVPADLPEVPPGIDAAYFFRMTERDLR